MHITLEADYAIRIVDCLAQSGQRMGAQAISDKTNVTLRFSLKILCKLVAGGIVRSYKGAQGGYEIVRPLDEISIRDVIEIIEGPIIFSRCLEEGHECSRNAKEWCPYHALFQEISSDVRDRLQKITFADTAKLGAG